MIRIEARKEMSNLLRTELKKRNIELTPYQFQSLVRYSKMNNRVGENQYNCTYLDITVDCWMHKYYKVCP